LGCFDELPWWFCGWFVYLCLSVQPPTKIAIFEKMGSCLVWVGKRGGLAFVRKIGSEELCLLDDFSVAFVSTAGKYGPIM